MKNSPRPPAWIKRNVRLSQLHVMKGWLRRSTLHTICEEARCPNIGECFARPTATFLIMGDVCTRDCRFCAVRHGRPNPLDPAEPSRVAEAARELGLSHVVVTSPTRDDLPDRGAKAFAATIRALRQTLPEASIEVLTPDFGGCRDLLRVVLEAAPDVFNHNVETVSRLQREIRPSAALDRSLSLLDQARRSAPEVVVKSGFMVGLGEQAREVEELLGDLQRSGVDIVTIGQYLQPGAAQVPVKTYWEREQFDAWAHLAQNLGIRYAVCGPLVRSSYRAKEALDAIRTSRAKECSE